MALGSEFIATCSEALCELFRTWSEMRPLDMRRVLRPTGPTSYAISIEAYRGSQTWSQFHLALEGTEPYRRLADAIRHYHAELLSYLVLPGRAMSLANPAALISTWCRYLEDRIISGPRLEDAVNDLWESLSQVLETRTLTQTTLTALAGVRLPSVEGSHELGPGRRLRPLSDAELIELGAEDLTFGHGNDILSHAVSSCFEIQQVCPFTLEAKAPDVLPIPLELEQNATSVTSVLRALHALKGGRAGVFLTRIEMSPKVLPFPAGSSWPHYRPIYPDLALEEDELPLFSKLEQELRESGRDELRIAADRLADAENRQSKVDALLDAVIGLEVLLNPMDASELAFRVALNYALIGPVEHRRGRYDRVRSVQKMRNRVVHGGLNTLSPDAGSLHEHAALAIACLRDTLQSFLLDDALRGNRKLDANFWLDRLFPDTLAANCAVEDNRTGIAFNSATSP